jgi:hypothetical protein
MDGVMNYKTAEELTKYRYVRRLAKNTWLLRVDESSFAIKLHDTNVVVIHYDGTFELFSGGFRTRTTKYRINRFSPACLFQRRNVWYIGDITGDLHFREGIVVDSNGHVTTRKQKPDSRFAGKRSLACN